MQEGCLRGTIGVIDGYSRAGAIDRLSEPSLVERRPGKQNRRGPVAPQMGEMGLAGAPRPVQQQDRRRPFGPAFDPAERRGVAVRNEKVFPAIGLAVRKVEHKLLHAPASCRRRGLASAASPIGRCGRRFTTPARSAPGSAPISRGRTIPTAPSSRSRRSSSRRRSRRGRRRAPAAREQMRRARSGGRC